MCQICILFWRDIKYFCGLEFVSYFAQRIICIVDEIGAKRRRLKNVAAKEHICIVKEKEESWDVEGRRKQSSPGLV